MKCPRCDFKLKTGALYCGRCGLARPRDEHAVDPLLGATLGGRYRVERRIGAGGMGTVYRGVDTRLGQPVAIKVLHERFTRDPQILPRFENEALACGRLIHPNLVTLHDYGQDKGLAYAVMEYCQGISLSHLLRRHDRLPMSLAVELIIQVAQALEVVHEGEVVHRDLKPDNILLVEVRPGRYHVKLLDFGIAKYLDEEGPGLTQAGMVFGTPEYMAPEQAKGEQVDRRADIYALGVILFELLAGQVPFSGKNRMNLMHQHAHDTPPELEAVAPVSLPEALTEVAMSCLEKNPEHRPQTAMGLIELLEEALAEAGEVSSHTTAEPAISTQITPPEGPAVAMSPPPTRINDAGASLAPMTTWALPGRGSLAVAGALLCVFVGTAAWVWSPDGQGKSGTTDAPTQTTASPKAQSGQKPAGHTGARPEAGTKSQPKGPADLMVWVGEPQKADTVVKAPKADPEPPKQKHAQAPKPVSPKQVTPKPAAPPKPEITAEQRAAERARRAAEAEAKAERQARDQAQRLLGEARRFLKHGKLDDADRTVSQALKTVPDQAEAIAFKAQLGQIRRELAEGRQLFEDGDCARAVKTLNPVLEVSPGAPGVSHIINNCRKSMPPKKL